MLNTNTLPGKQRGQAVLLTVLLVTVGVFVAVVTSTRPSFTDQQTDEETQALFDVTKAALISWSTSRDPSVHGAYARPGELPCPDTTNSGFADTTCAPGSRGRIPWRTLQIAEPKDRFGETLWYTIADTFRPYASNNLPITSDTVGNISIFQGSSPIPLTDQAIAVIFSPGSPLGTQSRDSAAEKIDPSNYLDQYTSPNINHATSTTTFISAPPITLFNDRLAFITNENLMPFVEQIVARKIISYLETYRLSTGIYPWADLADGNSNGDLSGAAYDRNRFPCGIALPYGWGRTTAPITPALPHWLTNGCWDTGWTSLIYYAVARGRLQNAGASCSICGSSTTITINNSGVATVCSKTTQLCQLEYITGGTADLILITPGGKSGSGTRNWPTNFNLIAGYFENFENYDNSADATYSVPTATTLNRDRIHIIR